MYKRILTLPLSETETCFLWGPRQTGKSTLLKTLFPNTKRYDLLLSNEYHRLLTNPGLIREECLAEDKASIEKILPVIIDEVQKIPALLDEVHWLIENAGIEWLIGHRRPPHRTPTTIPTPVFLLRPGRIQNQSGWPFE
jgi:predicted AAA+ superfamily ATPase